MTFLLVVILFGFVLMSARMLYIEWDTMSNKEKFGTLLILLIHLLAAIRLAMYAIGTGDW